MPVVSGIRGHTRNESKLRDMNCIGAGSRSVCLGEKVVMEPPKPGAAAPHPLSPIAISFVTCTTIRRRPGDATLTNTVNNHEYLSHRARRSPDSSAWSITEFCHSDVAPEYCGAAEFDADRGAREIRAIYNLDAPR